MRKPTNEDWDAMVMIIFVLIFSVIVTAPFAAIYVLLIWLLT